MATIFSTKATISGTYSVTRGIDVGRSTPKAVMSSRNACSHSRANVSGLTPRSADRMMILSSTSVTFMT